MRKSLCPSSESGKDSTLSVFEELRQNDELCDVKIAVRNHCIPAHRVVLAARIPFFLVMFKSGLKQCKEEKISIPEVDPDALESLINYAYGKEMEITDENVQSLFLAAEFLDLPDIRYKCRRFMIERLNPENILEVRKFAQHTTCLRLTKSCDLYILENLKHFIQSQHFLSLPFAVLKDILKGMVFYRAFYKKTVNEETIFEAVIAWIKATQATDDERQRLLPELFTKIQLERLSLDYLCEKVATEKLILESHVCRELVEEAKSSRILSCTTSIFSQLFYLPSRRERHSGNYYGVYAVCFSENFGLYVREYDTFHDKWVTLTQGVEMKSGFKNVVSQYRKIHVLGLETCRVFDLEELKWVKGEDTSLVLYCDDEVLHPVDEVYVFDNNPCSSNGCLVSDYVFKEDSSNDEESTAIRKRTKKILMPSYAFLSTYLYISGGQFEEKCLNTFHRYDRRKIMWTELPPMPTARFGHISVALRGKIYACGGMNDLQQNINTVEVFSVCTNEWLYVNPMKVSRSRFSLAPCFGGKLFAVGGAEESGAMYSVEIYDPEDGEWKYGPPLYVWDDLGKTKVKITSYFT